MRTSLTTRYDYVPSGTLWPSGDFSYGHKRIDWHGGGSPDFRLETQRIDDGDYLVGTRPGWEYHGRGRVSFDTSAAPAPTEHFLWPDIAAGGGSPLDLTNASNSHRANRPERYGRKGITSYGRNMVKSGAALMEKMPGKRLTFCTITMPALPRELRAALAEAWPEFMRQLIQRLSRWLKADGLPPLVASCTEIQEGRLKEYSEAYLHLHLVWPNRWARAGEWAIDVNLLRDWCSEFLQRRGLWCDGAWVNCDVQQVKKSAAGYLAKYMSKGVSAIEAMAEDCGWNAIPSQWWNMSKALRDMVKRCTRRGVDTGRVLEMAVDYVMHTGDMAGILLLAECTMEWDGRTIGVGWRGRLSQEYRKDLLRLIDSASQS